MGGRNPAVAGGIHMEDRVRASGLRTVWVYEGFQETGPEEYSVVES